MEPITRSEQYLASIIGEEVELPVPQSRIEHYLNVIAQNGVSPSSAGLINYDPDANYPDGSIGKEVHEIDGDVSLLKSQIAEDYEKKKAGKNLLNYQGSNKIDGAYVNYSTGKVATNAAFTAYGIPVTGGTAISINKTYLHVCFFSQIIDLSQYTLGEQLPGYISGVAGTSSFMQNQAVPANAVFMTVSTNTSNGATTQVEYGPTCTDYEAYEYGLDGNSILLHSLPSDRIIPAGEYDFTVKKDGTGDYSTIKAAVNAVNALPSYNHVTIHVYPGTYALDEEFTAEEKATTGFIGLVVPKNVSLIGEGDRGDIVLSYVLSVASASISTMNFSHNVELKNMTVYGERTRYAVHDDYSTLDFSHANGNYRKIENVDFISKSAEYQFAYGAGTHGNANWIFTNCRFINLTDWQCFSVHDAVSPMKDGDYFEFNNCQFIGTGAGTANVRLCPATSGYDATAVFNSCILNGILISSQYTGGENSTTVFRIYGSGNSDGIALTYYNDHDKLSFPMFPEICKAGISAAETAMSIGDYVKFSGASVVEGNSSDNDGVLFNDCDPGEVAYVHINVT